MLIKQIRALRNNEQILQNLKSQNRESGITDITTNELENENSEVKKMSDYMQVETSKVPEHKNSFWGINNNANRVPKNNPSNNPKKNHPKKDIEKTLGKNIMGVLASCLIFVALIMFASVALPKLTDEIKMAAMYILSFSIAGAGAYLLSKNPENKFNISVAGCGIGAVYISLLTTRLYFNAINDYVLYILLLLWAVGIQWYSKNKSKVFIAIEEIGITIAAIIGYIGADGDAIKFNGLILFGLIAETSVYLFNSKNNLKEDRMMHISHYTRIVIAIIASICSKMGIIPIGLSIIAGVYAMMKSEDYAERKALSIAYVFPIFFFGSLLISELHINDLEYNLALCFNALIIGVPLVTYALLNKNKFGTSLAAMILIELYMTVFCSSLFSFYGDPNFIATLAMVSIILVPAVILSIMTDDTRHKLTSILSILPLALIAYLSRTKSILVLSIIAASIAVVISICMIKWNEAEDDKVRLMAMYIGIIAASLIVRVATYSIVNMDKFNCNGIDMTITSIFIALSVAITTIVYRKDCLTKELSYEKLHHIIIGFLCFMNCIQLANPVILLSNGKLLNNFFEQFIFGVNILTGVAICAIYSKEYIEEYKHGGIMVGIAYVVTLFSLLIGIDKAINVDSYIVSILFVLLAFFCIVFGFKVNINDSLGDKEMRMFGLILSMISTLKLLLLDIQHNDMLETAFYILLAGGLCFGISFVYNKIDKNIATMNNTSQNDDN